jgi:predicted Rossmann fold nucleotide-binding protein DprA/Smf involved in DNA uptake/DNA-binding MarR family transcriptional regulator
MTDSQVIALLCAPLKLGDARPLSDAEWAHLAASVHNSPVGRPAALAGMPADALASELDLQPEMADRVARLLQRAGPLAFELERLSDRGVWLLTRTDEDYPGRLRRRLGLSAPPVLFGVGSPTLMSQNAVAVIGSREPSEEALEIARTIGRRLAEERAVVVSGGARGVDRAAMEGAISAGGAAVGFLSGGLVRETRDSEVRERVADGRLALVSPFAPDARFQVWQAMSRNRLIYCAADAAVVASASEGSGGTWAGAVEALRHRWVPVWVWDGPQAPSGNASLLCAGAHGMGGSLTAPGSLYDALVNPVPEAEAVRPDGADGLEDDLFAVAWPRLQSFLRISRTEAELRDHFGLEPAQAKAWTKRAVEADLVVKKRSPVRYVLAATAEQPPLPDTPDGNEDDLFAVAWPRLESFLGTSRTEAELRDHFGLEPAQAKAWTKRAVEADLVVKKKSPVRYVLAATAEQPTLFDA